MLSVSFRKSAPSGLCSLLTELKVAHELKEVTFEWGDSYDEKVLSHC